MSIKKIQSVRFPTQKGSDLSQSHGHDVTQTREGYYIFESDLVQIGIEEFNYGEAIAIVATYSNEYTRAVRIAKPQNAGAFYDILPHVKNALCHTEKQGEQFDRLIGDFLIGRITAW